MRNFNNKKNLALDLIYAECKDCSSPLLWNQQQSLQVLQALKVKLEDVSASHLFLSEGCPNCNKTKEFFPIELSDTEVTQYNYTKNTEMSFWTTKLCR